jgi:hypothetical protein
MKPPSITSSRTGALAVASRSSRAFPTLARLLIIFLTSHVVLLGVVLLLVD